MKAQTLSGCLVVVVAEAEFIQPMVISYYQRRQHEVPPGDGWSPVFRAVRWLHCILPVWCTALTRTRKQGSAGAGRATRDKFREGGLDFSSVSESVDTPTATHCQPVAVPSSQASKKRRTFVPPVREASESTGSRPSADMTRRRTGRPADSMAAPGTARTELRGGAGCS